MKKIVIKGYSTFMLLLLCMQSPAQKLGDAAERSAKLTEWMRINLNLTDEQLPPVRDINLKYAKKMDALQTNSLPKSEKMKQITDNDKEKDKELQSILTNSQFQTYLSKKQEIKKKFKENLKQRHQAG
ncbi:MAG TPA: hypothetical protein VGQ53_05360 [Chitinophagaceae bacterium]|jgi:hypothetical protein|nr:hypothetical protein [Chitinophagaceae bacterium]